MTTRATARHDVLEVLDPLGFRAGRIDLPTIWPAVSAWMREPASDVTPEGDERRFDLSFAPADTSAFPAGTFAGTPPEEIASLDLICFELGRDFNIRKPGESHQLGSVGVVLWYAAGKPWERLRQMPEWIDDGPSTPNLNAFWHGDDSEPLITWIKASPAYDVASREKALAAEVCDGDHPERLLVLAQPEQAHPSPKASGARARGAAGVGDGQ